jgi:hypothetical protein
VPGAYPGLATAKMFAGGNNQQVPTLFHISLARLDALRPHRRLGGPARTCVQVHQAVVLHSIGDELPAAFVRVHLESPAAQDLNDLVLPKIITALDVAVIDREFAFARIQQDHVSRR